MLWASNYVYEFIKSGVRMQESFQELWLVLIAGTTVVMVLFFAFISTIVICNRRLKNIQAQPTDISVFRDTEAILTGVQKNLQNLTDKIPGGEQEGFNKIKKQISQAVDMIKKALRSTP